MFTTRSITVALVVAGLSGCASSSEPPDEPAPVKLTAVSSSSVQQVTLTQRAAARLGIVTDPVTQTQVSVAGAAPTTVNALPYGAVVYDSDGSTWAYTSVGPYTYLRKPITVGSIQGDTVTLTAGPSAGTEVVVVGAPELLGAENQISGEE